MAVVQAKRINRSTDQEAENRQYQHTWEVIVDSQSGDDELVALSAAELPVLGQRHPTDLAAFVTSRKCRLRTERQWKIYTVDINYAIVTGQEDAVTRDPTQPPDLWPPEVRIRSVLYQRPVVRDLDRKPIRNTAGDVFPQFERMIDDYYAVVWFRKWYDLSDFDPIGSVFQWVGKVNADSWLNADIEPGMARIIDLQSEPVYHANTLYYRADFEVAIRTDDEGENKANTWQLKIPNVGMHVKGIDNQQPRVVLKLPVFTDDGLDTGIFQPVSEPVPLNQFGDDQLEFGADPIVNVFRVYDSLNFADIGL